MDPFNRFRFIYIFASEPLFAATGRFHLSRARWSFEHMLCKDVAVYMNKYRKVKDMEKRVNKTCKKSQKKMKKLSIEKSAHRENFVCFV